MDTYTPELARELARLAGRREDWQDLALCAQTDPDSFSPRKASRRVRPSGCVPPVRSAPNAYNTPWTTGSGSACGVACPSGSAVR